MTTQYGQGWYQDPTGRFALRFWDGAQWTDQVNNGTTNFVDPTPDSIRNVPPAPGTRAGEQAPQAAAPPPMQVTQQSSSSGGTIVAVVLSVIAIILVIVVVVNLVVGALEREGNARGGDRVDRWCRWVFPVTYFGLIGVMVGVTFAFF